MFDDSGGYIPIIYPRYTQDGAENLLALCPAWTIGTVNDLKDLAEVAGLGQV